MKQAVLLLALLCLPLTVLPQELTYIDDWKLAVNLEYSLGYGMNISTDQDTLFWENAAGDSLYMAPIDENDRLGKPVVYALKIELDGKHYIPGKLEDKKFKSCSVSSFVLDKGHFLCEGDFHYKLKYPMFSLLFYGVRTEKEIIFKEVQGEGLSFQNRSNFFHVISFIKETSEIEIGHFDNNGSQKYQITDDFTKAEEIEGHKNKFYGRSYQEIWTSGLIGIPIHRFDSLHTGVKSVNTYDDRFLVDLHGSSEPKEIRLPFASSPDFDYVGLLGRGKKGIFFSYKKQLHYCRLPYDKSLLKIRAKDALSKKPISVAWQLNNDTLPTAEIMLKVVPTKAAYFFSAYHKDYHYFTDSIPKSALKGMQAWVHEVKLFPLSTERINRFKLTFFAYGSSELSTEGKRELFWFARLLQDNPKYGAVIRAHTDNQSSATFNQQLSEARAESIRNFLIKIGIEKQRLRTRAFGETEAIADNSTEEGRRENRRVEYRLILLEDAP